MYERISINPKICHGQVCIKGTRIPVHQVIGMLANGDTIEKLLKEYPSLKRKGILYLERLKKVNQIKLSGGKITCQPQ